ncbi:MAG: hypothetical protein P8N02_17995 [Actinomycetota bacterium]|jgi:hypothetical protein|nr:hypothetical protein [Actinomycetota bacterium]
MTKPKNAGLLLAAGLMLSSCSLLDTDETPAVQSDQSALGTVSPAAQTPLQPALNAAPTQAEISAELQALYLLHGIEGSPVFDDEVWFLDGTARDQTSLSEFLGAARRVPGVSVTRNFIVVAAPAVSTPDAQTTGGQDGVQTDDTASGSAQDTAAPEAADDALARTGLSLNLALIASLLILAGAAAVSTGRHIWVRTQFTNCFRVAASTTTFTVKTRQRPWFEAYRSWGRGPRPR